MKEKRNCYKTGDTSVICIQKKISITNHDGSRIPFAKILLISLDGKMILSRQANSMGYVTNVPENDYIITPVYE